MLVFGCSPSASKALAPSAWATRAELEFAVGRPKLLLAEGAAHARAARLRRARPLLGF